MSTLTQTASFNKPFSQAHTFKPAPARDERAPYKGRSDLVETENGHFDKATFYRIVGSNKGISKVAEAVTSILTESGISPQRRGLILALIGESGGSPEPIHRTSFALGKRLYDFDESATENEQKKRQRSIERMVRREIKKLIKEQEAAGITLVHVKEGKQIRNSDGTTDNIPSVFTLHILPLIQSTLNEFKFQKGANRMHNAARVAIKNAGASLSIPPKTSNRRQPDQTAIAHKQALTWAQRYATLSGDKLTAIDELIEELKELKQEGGRTRESGGLVALQAELTILPDNNPEASRVLYSYESQGGTLLEETDADLESLPGGVGATEGAPLPPCDSQAMATDAQRALDAFLSVEAQPDQILFKDDEEKKVVAERAITAVEFGEQVEGLIDDAKHDGFSFIARIRGPVLQTDDCEREAMELLKRFCFLVVETSPENFQCWIAFADEADKGAVRDRWFKGLSQILPGTKANAGSGGALRWPSSQNLKPERITEPGAAWTVRVGYVDEGRIVTPAELDEFGLLGPLPEVSAEQDASTRPTSSGWPSYQIALAGALKKSDGMPDESNADARFVTVAITRFGWTNSERKRIAEKLREVSEHARDREPEDYALKTVNRVADYLHAQKGVSWA